MMMVMITMMIMITCIVIIIIIIIIIITHNKQTVRKAINIMNNISHNTHTLNKVRALTKAPLRSRALALKIHQRGGAVETGCSDVI